MILIEAARQSVSHLDSSIAEARQASIANFSKLTEKILESHKQVAEFITENRRLLSEGVVAPVEFGEIEQAGSGLKDRLLVGMRSLLPMLEPYPEISESSNGLALQRIMRELEHELRDIDFHRRSMDAFLEKHPLPEAWLDPTFAADSYQDGIDLGDYLASLPR